MCNVINSTYVWYYSYIIYNHIISYNSIYTYIFLGINRSPSQGNFESMIFLFHRWDMWYCDRSLEGIYYIYIRYETWYPLRILTPQKWLFWGTYTPLRFFQVLSPLQWRVQPGILRVKQFLPPKDIRPMGKWMLVAKVGAILNRPSRLYPPRN